MTQRVLTDKERQRLKDRQYRRLFALLFASATSQSTDLTTLAADIATIQSDIADLDARVTALEGGP